jgi:hypothetical protein
MGCLFSSKYWTFECSKCALWLDAQARIYRACMARLSKIVCVDDSDSMKGKGSRALGSEMLETYSAQPCSHTASTSYMYTIHTKYTSTALKL